MQHLSLGSLLRGHPSTSTGFRGCQGWVRFFALRRIKPHAPPLVRAPVNSFEFQPCGRTPQAGCLIALASTPRGSNTPDTQHPSFTAWTTRVSNPVCSPRFRASASVPTQRAAFATGVLPDICAFHRYTRNSTLLFRTRACGVSRAGPRLSRGISHETYQAAYDALYAQ